MDSGWSAYVPPPPLLRSRANAHDSGEMLPFTPSPPAPSSGPATSTTSATLAIATRRSSIAQPTPQRASCPASPGSRRRRSTTASASRRTDTGTTLTRPRRMVSGAAAAATRTLSTSRARRAAAWPSGSTLPVAGPVLDWSMTTSSCLCQDVLEGERIRPGEHWKRLLSHCSCDI